MNWTSKKQRKFTIQIAGPPVEVGVTMYVLSISSLSEVKMVQKKGFEPIIIFYQ